MGLLRLRCSRDSTGSGFAIMLSSSFKSCCSFIAAIAEQRFGFNPAPVSDLTHWTDIIDGAMYPDAKTAVEMREPAMKLTMIIESAQDYGFVARLIPLLATKPLANIL